MDTQVRLCGQTLWEDDKRQSPAGQTSERKRQKVGHKKIRRMWAALLLPCFYQHQSIFVCAVVQKTCALFVIDRIDGIQTKHVRYRRLCRKREGRTQASSVVWHVAINSANRNELEPRIYANNVNTSRNVSRIIPHMHKGSVSSLFGKDKALYSLHHPTR